jgi:hypothetical protein
MKKKLLVFIFLISTTLATLAQTGTISGLVTDAVTAENLVGVNIMYSQGKGMVSDLDGKFAFSLPYGEYQLTFSYVGYEQVIKKVILNKPSINVKINLVNTTLKEVEVIADVAKTRETPVAFSSIKPTKLAEELGSQDLPMILNSTPGVYATQQGGGDGDARINIRGFNQRNVAVMLDGIPVNDMENGWVYWSNWFGLDMATRSIQVQRGLGASKLALPSIGGTMNIITKGIEAKAGATIKQEFGNDGFSRTSLALSTGPLKKGWGITFAGSYKQGNGWVQETWTKGYFYYLRIDKKLGNHLLTASAMGAPQQHGQRAYKKPITLYSTDYAESIGMNNPEDYIDGLPTNLGLRYNSHWGYLTRTAEGETSPNKINEIVNFYHKPMFSLRDYWNISPKMYMSNIVYLSIGNGGGTGLTHTTNPIADGTTNFQSIYDANVKGVTDPTIKGTNDIIRASMNNHFWLGLLSTVDYKISKQLNVSGGIDLRTYKGEHYRTAYDMLGASKYIDLVSLTQERNNYTDPNYLKSEGDKILYNNDGLVRWGGLFGQLKYQSGNWSIFTNLSLATTGYKRIDYFKKKDLVIDGVVYSQAVGYHDSTRFVFPIGDVTTVYSDTLMVNGKAYHVNSPEARYAETNWKYIPGFTVKAGANYNITESQNVFFNAGYLNKAPRFSNVYDNNNREYRDIKNEKIMATEIGYSFTNKRLALNFNAYITYWQNKPADRAFTFRDNDENVFSVNINGMDALHKGLEGELSYEITKGLTSETSISLGDWRWMSSDSAEVVDDNTGTVVGYTYYMAKGLYVGDAAQTQLYEGIRWQLPWKAVKGVYVKSSVTYFAKFYSEFDPISLDPNKSDNKNAFNEDGTPKQSWRIPNYYLVDAFAGYHFKIKKLNFDLRFAVYNLLDATYISDAQNNDSYGDQVWNDSEARSATVFFGMGRRFTTSLAMRF